MLFALESFEITPTVNFVLIIGLFLIFGILSPLMFVRQVNRTQATLKKKDLEKQEALSSQQESVAKKVVEAAELVAQRQRALDAKADQVARQGSEAVEHVLERQRSLEGIVSQITTSTGVLVDQLTDIHSLVESHMTQSIRSELDSARDTLALMSEVIVQHKKSGIEPNVDVVASIRGREAKIKELSELLASREGGAT